MYIITYIYIYSDILYAMIYPCWPTLVPNHQLYQEVTAAGRDVTAPLLELCASDGLVHGGSIGSGARLLIPSDVKNDAVR